MATTSSRHHTFIVEHLDPELEDWQGLEYNAIAAETAAAGSTFLLSGLSKDFDAAAKDILKIPDSSKSHTSIETLYATPEQRHRVCLLDPKGEKDLCPEDGDEFEAFLFGGILGEFSKILRWSRGGHCNGSFIYDIIADV